MSNVIPAEGRFAERAKENLKVNMFIIHKEPADIIDFIDGAMSYRTEIIKQGHPDQFLVTGVLFTHIAITDDGYTDPVMVIECSGCSTCTMADCISDHANDQGLLNFITNGAVGLHLMVLGGCYENPSLPIMTDVITVGPRMVEDENDHTGNTLIENPETYNVCWGDLQSFIVGEILGQCCCGRPQDVLRFCHDTIEHLGMKQWRHGEGELKDTDSWKNRMAAEAKYGSGPLYYVWHNLENLGFLEHGGSAPGWLTGEGEHFLALMQIEIASDPEDYADGR